ncbi:unnamed protein product [Amaranthus hypochondriacus]
MAIFFCFFFFLLFTSANAGCSQCIQSKATFFGSSNALSSGACGYGPLALDLYGGHVAAAIPSIYGNGEGCGACYQIKCKNSTVCKSSGTHIVVTDIHNDTNKTTDFVLSTKALRAIALPGKDKHLLHLGVIDVEYTRVPCVYKGQNLAIRVEEFSKPPNYLAIKVLYQGGQTLIFGGEVLGPVDQPHHIAFLSRKYGAMWETDRAPTGNLTFRFVIGSGFDARYFYTNEGVLPANWKPGVIYNSTVQISDVLINGCEPCKPWK